MKKWKRLLPGCVIVVGLFILGYPMVSKKVNAGISERVIKQYAQNTSGCSEDQMQTILQAAVQYNASLSEKAAKRDVLKETKQLTKKEQKTYESILNVNGDGIMGYLEIPCISVKLPIYHGTDDETMQKGVGHMVNSSFPVHGKSVHSVLSSHTGMSNASLFDRLTEIKEGDRFYVHVLNQVTEYRVDAIFVVLPDDFSKLRIEDGKEYVTLLTCTPYGVNSHRLLVRGTAVKTEKENQIMGENKQEEALVCWWKLMVGILGAGVLATIVFICLRCVKR